MDMKNRFRFLNTAGVHRGGLSTVFTQDSSGSINIVIPFELQDFPKVIGQPSVADLKRYFKGGNCAAYGSVAMIKLQYAIGRAIEECCEALGSQDTKQIKSEIERLVRPSLFVNKLCTKFATNHRHSCPTYSTRRKSLKDFIKKEVMFNVNQDTELDPNTMLMIRESSALLSTSIC